MILLRLIPILFVVSISILGMNQVYADSLTVSYEPFVDSFTISYDFPNSDNCVTRSGVFAEPYSMTLDNPHYFPMDNTMNNGTIMYDWFDLQYYNQQNAPVEKIDCSGLLFIPLDMFEGESDFRIWTYFYELENPNQWDSWTDPLIHQTFIEYTDSTFDPNRSYQGCAVEKNLSMDNSTTTQRTMNPNGITCSIP